MRRAMTSLALVAVASIGFVLAASGVGEGGRQLQVVTVGDLRTFRLPLDRFRLSEQQANTVNYARNILFVGCMRRFGFKLQVPSRGGLLPLVGNERRYGVTDEQQAKMSGYHPPATPTGSPPKEPSLSPAAQAVADGLGPRTHGSAQVPAGGCLGQALRELAKGGPIPADPDLAERLGLESYVRSSQVEPMRAVFTKWAACMKQAGFDYADPRKANNDPAFRTERASKREIATAVADVRCKREVHMVDAWATVETAYQQRQVAQHKEQLEILADALQTQTRNAARITAGA